MRIGHLKNHKRISISPGEYYVIHEDVLITTLLGACVSACLYDPYNRIECTIHYRISAERKIPLVSSDSGGTVGRVIHFYSEGFSVYVRKMVAKTAKVIQREAQYWEKTIHMQEEAKTQIDLW